MYEGEKEMARCSKENLVARVASIDKRLRELSERVDKFAQRFNELCSQIGMKI